MPQLDKFAFAPQVFWLVVAFFSLYFLVLYSGLPTLFRVLVFRKRAIQSASFDVFRLVNETFFLQASTTKLLSAYIGSRNVFDNLFKLLDSYIQIQQNRFVTLNNVRVGFVSSVISVKSVGSKQSLPLVVKSSQTKIS